MIFRSAILEPSKTLITQLGLITIKLNLTTVIEYSPESGVPRISFEFVGRVFNSVRWPDQLPESWTRNGQKIWCDLQSVSMQELILEIQVDQIPPEEPSIKLRAVLTDSNQNSTAGFNRTHRIKLKKKIV